MHQHYAITTFLTFADVTGIDSLEQVNPMTIYAFAKWAAIPESRSCSLAFATSRCSSTGSSELGRAGRRTLL